MPQRFSSTPILLAAAALAVPAAAQTVPTIPIQSVLAEGVSTSFAFTAPTFRRTQVLYESRFVYGGLSTWNAFLLRPDGSSAVPNFPAVSRHLTVRVSADGVPSPERASQRSFAANHGRDLTTVVRDRLVAFPAVGQRPRPAPFAVTVPFDAPFPRVQAGHLLVEFETRDEGTPATPWYADAEFFQAAGWTVFASVSGRSCPDGQTFFGAGYDAQSNRITTTCGFARQPGQPPQHPAVATVGTSLSRWGPFPLPFALDGFGAPGCAVYTDVLQSYVGMTGGGSAERYTLSLPVPRDFGLLGQRLHSQTFIADPAVNAFGLRASAVATFEFSSPPDAHRTLTLWSPAPGDAVAHVETNRALVLGVR